MHNIKGFILVFVSAVSFGIIPIFIQYAYSDGLNTQSILFFRFSTASLAIWLIVFAMKKKLPRGKDILILFLLGFFGYSGQSFSYFKALQYIPPALVAILLYLYPVIVTLLSVFVLKEKLTPKKWTALVLAVAGTVLVIGFQAGSSVIGVLLGISAALIYSVYILTSSKVLKANNTFSAAAVIVTSSSFFYLLFTLKTDLILPQTAFCWTNMLLMGVISTALPVYAFFSGVKLIGAVSSSMISTFEPVATIIFAAMIFGDRITLLQGAGTLLIIAAAIILSAREKSAAIQRR